MRTILLSLLIFPFGINAFAQIDGQKSQPALDAEIRGIADFMNTFPTIGDLLVELEKFRLINSHERAATERYLKSAQINMNKTLAAGSLIGKSVQWDNVKIEVTSRVGSFKAEHGRIFNLPVRGKTFDQVFIESFESFAKKKNVAWISSLWIESAHADDEGISGKLSAAAYLATYHAAKTVATAFAAVGAVSLNVLGYGLEPIATGLRNLRDKGTVSCDLAGRYTLHGGYKHPDWKKRFDEVKKGCTNPKDNELAANCGYSANAMGALVAGGSLLSAVGSPEKKEDTPISEEVLRQIWTDIPKCESKNAALVQKHIRQKANESYLDIQQKIAASPDRAKGKGSNTSR